METVAKYKPNLEVVPDPEALARRTVDIFIDDAKKALRRRNAFYVAISGGNTPRHFFEILGDLPRAMALQWQNIQLFWVDERCVPPDSKYSNYKLAADTFLPKVPIPPDNVHPIPTEHSDSSSAARAYEQTIRRAFALKENELPTFDLMLLGMGPDGHTGSLFPNSYASFDKDDLACAVYVLDQKLNRITLTHPVLCAAAHLAVLVSGEEKARILKEVLTSPPDEVRYPIHVLWPILDKVTWLVDANAAKLL
jgi:6-phosphogluconolactonase